MGGVGFADSSAPDFVAAAFTSRVAAFGCLLPSLTVTGVGAARDSALVSLLATSTLCARLLGEREIATVSDRFSVTCAMGREGEKRCVNIEDYDN